MCAKMSDLTRYSSIVFSFKKEVVVSSSVKVLKSKIRQEFVETWFATVGKP